MSTTTSYTSYSRPLTPGFYGMAREIDGRATYHVFIAEADALAWIAGDARRRAVWPIESIALGPRVVPGLIPGLGDEGDE